MTEDRILFLDIDGVLNHQRMLDENTQVGTQYPFNELCSRSIGYLNAVTHATGAKIVISSTWRSMDNLDWILMGAGIEGDIIDVTPDLTEKLDSGLWYSPIRGEEIQAWLVKHLPAKYAIVDDNKDILPSQLPYFVRTDNITGLDAEKANRLIEILT